MREIIKIKTAGGNEVELYSYITGGESREISNIFLKGMKFQVGSDGQTHSNEISGELTGQAQDLLIQKLIVSVNGIKENILDQVLSLPKPDFDEVIAKLDEVQNGLNAEKKTN